MRMMIDKSWKESGCLISLKNLDLLLMLSSGTHHTVDLTRIVGIAM